MPGLGRTYLSRTHAFSTWCGAGAKTLDEWANEFIALGGYHEFVKQYYQAVHEQPEKLCGAPDFSRSLPPAGATTG